MENPRSLPVRLQPSNLRPIAYRTLSKKHGLNIQTDALKVLTDTVSYKFGSEWKGPQAQQFLEQIAKTWKQQDRGIFIDGNNLTLVIKEILGKKESTPEAVKRLNGMDKESSEVTSVAKEETPESFTDWMTYFKIVNPDEQPQYKFNNHRKHFDLVFSKASKASHMLNMGKEYFLNRYFLINDRLSRNDHFQKPSFSSVTILDKKLKGEIPNSEITPIKNVLGRDGHKFILFGLLYKNPNDDYVLEDASDVIELDLSQALKTEGSFYSPGMFVIVEGIYYASGGTVSSLNLIGGCFCVSNMAHPPAERREQSLENYGHLDFMGIISQNYPSDNGNQIVKVTKQLKKSLVQMEKSLDEHHFLILGCNCFLDNSKVLDGLTKFFRKLEGQLINEEITEPLALVLIGSFVSTPLTPTSSSIASITNSEDYKSNFDNLSHILSEFPTIVNTVKLVLIPGINDPWQSTFSLGAYNVNTLPQKSLPRLFLNRLERLLPNGNLVNGWNPLRINYLSQEIVVFRDDMVNHLKRNEIILPSDIEKEVARVQSEMQSDGQIHAHEISTATLHIPPKIKQARKWVKTILDQGHLQPFMSKSVDPNYSQSLRIEPLPTTLILCDSTFPTFEVTYNGCKVANVGDIMGSKRKLNYTEYIPSSRSFHFREVYF